MAAAIDALVPVKELHAGKSRLHPILSPDQRERLVKAMLAGVLGAIDASGACRRVWVISRDAELLSLAQKLRGYPLLEPWSSGGLNAALEWARATLLRRTDPPNALLILPADLPDVMAEDICAFVAEQPHQPFVRLCPSPDGGTNALLVRPPDAIPFAFGAASAATHARLAQAKGIDVELRETPGLRCDLDGPADLTALQRGGGGSQASDLLRLLA